VTLGEYGEWGHGGLRLPLDATGVDSVSLLTLADPALAAALAFLPAVLDLQIGAALRAYALRERISISAAVLSTANVEPVPALYADKTRFPFFALYRKGELTTGHTIGRDKSVAEWEFAYVLPALMPVAQQRLAPILHAVVGTLRTALRVGWHPLYLGGAKVLKDAGIMSSRLGPVRYERYERLTTGAPGGNDQFYRAVLGSIEVVERDEAVVGAFPAFTGTNVITDEQAADGTKVLVSSEFTARVAPTLTSITPNSGTKAGGTSVTVAGTGFFAPAKLTIGGVEVIATVVSSTSATAVTPPHEAYPTFMADVLFTNGDGQTARMPAAFSFTTP